jgi:hypothetical protein
MLTSVKSGLLRGLTNRKLFEIRSKIQFFDRLPELFEKIKNFINGAERNQRYKITLEHYRISSGLAEIIRGSSIAKYVNGIYAYELIEDPLPPNF